MCTDPGRSEASGGVERTLADMEARLSRIEVRLGLRLPVPQQSAVIAPVPPPVVPVVLVEQQQVATALPAPNPPIEMRDVADPAARLEELARKRAAAMAAREGSERPPVVRNEPLFQRIAGPIPAEPRSARARHEDRPVETNAVRAEGAIGGKIAAYLGAIFLVIGLALGVTYGIKQGWFTFPPAYRCAGVALCGLGLIGGGWVVRRRLGESGQAAMAGLGAAGIGALYGAALAAWGMYGLYSSATAFVLLAIISAGGVGLGLWWRSLPLGVLALVGAYLNPLWMHNQQSSPVVLPAYLVALAAMALSLAAWRPRPYRVLRVIAWWGTVVIGYGWVFATGLDHPVMAVVFLGMVWCLVHGELVLGSVRETKSDDARGVVRSAIARPMRSSFATTAWAVGSGMIVAAFGRVQIGLEEWQIAAGGFAGTLALALVLAGHLRVFTDAPRDDRERLGVALWMQAGALLVTTVALGVGGSMQVVAWLAMGAAAIGAGRWARARSLDVYGVIVLGIATVRLVIWESWHGGAGRMIAGVSFSWWTLLMALGGAAWLAGAWMLHRPSRGSGEVSATRRAGVDLAMCAGVTLASAGCMFGGTLWQMMGVVGGVWAVVMFGLARWRESAMLRGFGVAGLALVSAAMGLGHLIEASGVPLRVHAATWSAPVGTLVVTGGTLTLLWLAAVWVAGAMLGAPGRNQTDERQPWVAIVMVGVGVTMSGFAFVTPGTSWGAVAAAWACVGAALAALHGWRRTLALDVMGVALLSAAGFAWGSTYALERDWLAETFAPFGHPGLWVGVLVAGLMLAAGVWMRRGKPMRATWEPAAIAALAAGGVLMLVGTSLEVSRSAGILLPRDAHAQAAALTVWWGVCAAVLLAVGFVRGRPLVRHLGLGLLGLASLKAVVYDLAGVELGWRVVSFLGLGAVMMGVAVGYGMLARRMEKMERERANP